MLNVKEFLKVAVVPDEEQVAWLEGATTAVDYVVANSRSEDIILYTTVGQTYFHSVLAPLENLSPVDGDDLIRMYAGTDSTWSIEHCSGGGEPDRVYLASPLDSPGCKSLNGGEQLVFRRFFHDVDQGNSRTEISQRLVHALGLYWVEEESAFCRLDDDGDIEPIIHLLDMSGQTGQPNDLIVTINAHQLHRYMAVTDMALVMKFDFTRYNGFFGGWHDPARSEHRSPDLFYNSGVQSSCSFANGVLVVRPRITKQQMIAKNQRDWSGVDKEYATFKALDRKHGRLAEISCAPTALASYFEQDSPLPWQVTPAFFKPDVLLKYKANSEKYTLEHRSIRSRAGWYLKTYDVNDEGQVHTYLCYLANLPYSEQLYWQSFNEWPKAYISKRAHQTDIEGSFTTIEDALIDLKAEVSRLDNAKPDWWLPRGEALAGAVHYPLTASPDEWANAILALDQLVVEGISARVLKARLRASGKEFDEQWGSLKLVQQHAIAAGKSGDDSEAIVEPLKQLHYLRSKVKGHAAEAEKRKLIKAARAEHGSLAAHFKFLAADCQTAFDRIVELLGP